MDARKGQHKPCLEMSIQKGFRIAEHQSSLKLKDSAPQEERVKYDAQHIKLLKNKTKISSSSVYILSFVA